MIGKVYFKKIQRTTTIKMAQIYYNNEMGFMDCSLIDDFKKHRPLEVLVPNAGDLKMTLDLVSGRYTMSLYFTNTESINVSIILLSYFIDSLKKMQDIEIDLSMEIISFEGKVLLDNQVSTICEILQEQSIKLKCLNLKNTGVRADTIKKIIDSSKSGEFYCNKIDITGNTISLNDRSKILKQDIDCNSPIIEGLFEGFSKENKVNFLAKYLVYDGNDTESKNEILRLVAPYFSREEISDSLKRYLEILSKTKPHEITTISDIHNNKLEVIGNLDKLKELDYE